jgi:NADH:ubiquinone oxidoreductase subunit F (NADH-binding)
VSAVCDPARLLAGCRRDGGQVSLAEHIATHGSLELSRRRRGLQPALVDLIGRSGLRGRGGAGFPAARKLQQVSMGGGRAVVVANGSEGEPASAKDRTLMQATPHLVLDGAAFAAAAVGANRVVVAVNGRSHAAVAAALGERAAAGVDAVAPEICVVPDRFIAGQETALVDFVGGGPGLPTFAPPRPAERGVGGRPTLVSNTETLAHMALIARHGAEWFRTAGTEAEPGSTLVTLLGPVVRPGVYEIERGAPIGALLADAGGLTAPLQALLVGGFAGAWLPAARAGDARLSDATLAPFGATLGAGVIIALPEADCGLTFTARLLEYLAGETAGQCGPCVRGLPAMADGMAQLAEGRAGRGMVERLEAWAWQVTGRGACRHPDGAARLAQSALRTFAPDLADHRRGRPCRGAGETSPYLAGLPAPPLATSR